MFNEEIKKAVQHYKEFEGKFRVKGQSEFAELFEEINKLRSEIHERLDAISEEITELKSLRKGLFS